jgi:hypothetical protein
LCDENRVHGSNRRARILPTIFATIRGKSIKYIKIFESTIRKYYRFQLNNCITIFNSRRYYYNRAQYRHTTTFTRGSSVEFQRHEASERKKSFFFFSSYDVPYTTHTHTHTHTHIHTYTRTQTYTYTYTRTHNV